MRNKIIAYGCQAPTDFMDMTQSTTALKKLKRESTESPYVFISQRGAPLSSRIVRHLVSSAGKHAKFTFPVHPHMLRHSTGFYLANKGHDTRAIQSYLGHANINNTVIYTQLVPDRFKDF